MSKVYTPSATPLHERSYGYQTAPVDHHSLRNINDYLSYPSIEKRYETENRSQLRTPPMAEDNHRRPYEPTQPARISQEYTRRPEPSAPMSRESLPSLRDILADPREEAPRPSFHSRAPSYTSNQQDLRRIGTPVHQDRSPWEYQRPSSSQYSHDRPAPSPNTELPPPRMPLSRGPNSPSFQDPRYSPQEVSRPHPSPWSPRTEAPAREYFPAGRDGGVSYARPQVDTHHALPLPRDYRRESEVRPAYSTTSPSTPTYPPTPASTVAAEPATTKDGLGPKIWTGTQFLPRFVRQAEVPGEGMCYFYDDGTHCKTHIDGEAVNAHWGVTKAGKPRKRLAIACITCREKKIKCDPDYPRCIQCEKFGRTCRFKNAPRGGQGSPESPAADVDESTLRPVSRSDAGSYKLDKSTRSVSPRTISHPSPEHDSSAAKRRRVGYGNEFTPVKSEYDQVFHNTSPSDRQWAAANVKPREPLTLKWPNNPYEADPALVKELVKVYFNNIASTAYQFISEEPFMAWLESSETKSQDDILLIYALLAAATMFSPKHGAADLGERLAKTSRFASSSSYSLQVVQARFLFALYFESSGDLERSWECLGGALRAATGIKLHLEPTTKPNGKYPFGMSLGSYKETCRRTFWSCYIMDRLGAFRDGRLSTISTEDIFLRMPCDNLAFNQQKDVQNPHFTPEMDLTYNRDGTFGAMAYLIAAVTMYGEITAAVWRFGQGMKIRNAGTFYEDMSARLERWYNSVPPCITMSKDNVDKVTEFGLLGTFAAMHAVYRASQIRLNSSLHQSIHYTSPQPYLAERERIAIKHAEGLIRDSAYLSVRQNQAIGRVEKACGKLPAFAGIALFDGLRFLNSCGSGRTMGGRTDDAEDVLQEVSSQWPFALRPSSP